MQKQYINDSVTRVVPSKFVNGGYNACPGSRATKGTRASASFRNMSPYTAVNAAEAQMSRGGRTTSIAKDPYGDSQRARAPARAPADVADDAEALSSLAPSRFATAWEAEHIDDLVTQRRLLAQQIAVIEHEHDRVLRKIERKRADKAAAAASS